MFSHMVGFAVASYRETVSPDWSRRIGHIHAASRHIVENRRSCCRGNGLDHNRSLSTTVFKMENLAAVPYGNERLVGQLTTWAAMRGTISDGRLLIYLLLLHILLPP